MVSNHGIFKCDGGDYRNISGLQYRIAPVDNHGSQDGDTSVFQFTHPAIIATLAHDSGFGVKLEASPCFLASIRILSHMSVRAVSESFPNPLAPEMFGCEIGCCRAKGAVSWFCPGHLFSLYFGHYLVALMSMRSREIMNFKVTHYPTTNPPNNSLRPEDFPVGSPESRAAARAVVEASNRGVRRFQIVSHIPRPWRGEGPEPEGWNKKPYVGPDDGSPMRIVYIPSQWIEPGEVTPVCSGCGAPFRNTGKQHGDSALYEADCVARHSSTRESTDK
jgi:hypothetical protein